MMKKMKTPRVAQLKALLIVPLIAGLLLAFASPQINGQSISVGKQTTVTGTVTDQATGKIITGCVVTIRGTTEGTMVTEDGTYKLVIKNPTDVLVFSNVGYKTVEMAAGRNSVINVQLEQNILSLDFSNGNKFVLTENKPTVKKNDNQADEVFIVVEELPRYPGGTDALLQFLQANLNYPETAKEKGIEGEVTVSYTINTLGEVTNAKIMRGISPEIDAEAIRLTNSIKGWKPALQHGNPTPMVVSMPIEFTINR